MFQLAPPQGNYRRMIGFNICLRAFGRAIGEQFFDGNYLWTAHNTASINQQNVVA
jgi:hypothetical protein